MYFDLARNWKKLWNMLVTIIPIVIGEFWTVTKGLLKGLEDLEVGGRVETIQTTSLLRTAEYWEESWRPEETCFHTDFSEKTSVKNSKGVNNNNDNTLLLLLFLLLYPLWVFLKRIRWWVSVEFEWKQVSILLRILVDINPPFQAFRFRPERTNYSCHPMLHNILVICQSLGTYLSFRVLWFFSFRGPLKRQILQGRQVLFFFSCLLVWIKESVYISKSRRVFFFASKSLKQILVCAYTMKWDIQISVSGPISSGSPFPPHLA